MQRPEATNNAIEREVLKRGGGLQSRMALEDTFYIEERPEISELVAPYDYLFPFDNRIKHSPEGSLWILSYPPILKATEDMFPDLPPAKKPKKVSQRRWSNPDDIETAIRMSGHIADTYKPKEGEVAKDTLGVVDHVKQLSYDYQQPGITEVERENLATQTAEILVATKFANARKPEKLKIRNMLLHAGQRDSLARLNTSRSRIIISNAWIDLSRELIVNRTIGEKYRTMEWRLMQERDMERFCLEQTVARINALNGRRTSSPEFTRLRKDLELFVYTYNSSDYIRAKPYSNIAAISRFLMFGDGQKPAVDESGNVVTDEMNSDLKTLSRYIGADAGMFWGTRNFRTLTSDEQLRRLEAVGVAISQTLEEGANNLKKAA